MRLILLFVLAGLPAAAQFRSITIWFKGGDCASCTESMGDRMRRLRGVESATVTAQEGKLEVKLAEQNRVRVEQVRDLIEQDGTKTTRAVVRITGDLSDDNGRWILKVAGLPARYEVIGPGLTAGPIMVDGEVRNLHPESGIIQIHR